MITALYASDTETAANKLVAALDAPFVKAAFRRGVVEALALKTNGGVLDLGEMAIISKNISDNPMYGIGIGQEKSR